MKIQTIRNHVGDGGMIDPQGDRKTALRQFRPEQFIMAPKYADKNPDALLTRQGIVVLRPVLTKPRILTSLPRRFDKQPGLGVQHLCLMGRDVKKQRIEAVDVINKTAVVVEL